MSSSATASGSGSSYLAARKRLDQMGYFQSLTRECIPLVEALLSDLSKYKDLAVKRTGEDRSSGRAGEPRLQEDRGRIKSEFIPVRYLSMLSEEQQIVQV